MSHVVTPATQSINPSRFFSHIASLLFAVRCRTVVQRVFILTLYSELYLGGRSSTATTPHRTVKAACGLALTPTNMNHSKTSLDTSTSTYPLKRMTPLPFIHTRTIFASLSSPIRYHLYLKWHLKHIPVLFTLVQLVYIRLSSTSVSVGWNLSLHCIRSDNESAVCMVGGGGEG